MTLKSPDGAELLKDSKTYTPVPGRMACGQEMGRGPYEKSGLVRDTSLPPGRQIIETFDIEVPHEKVKVGKEIHAKLASKDIDVDVELWYLPFGERKGPLAEWNRIWRKETKRLTFE